ncbi:polysaccharide ABC transporter ATP-binding protein [Sphingomonas sp. LB-2]|uniref:ABC transporter ATP-binding protein n=1 Tax=Sphingomonas caeni TaxID=2984949 RepID=UPI0022320B69|nr:polysaccharide ABC transporter ATP-binding protein [Sphingomonas caeni]MCW3849356.1 polysaccharide ABC transporter ATP-binding protein [Sphingomonas caeni]
MTSAPVIHAEGLGKSYRLLHRDEGMRYQALRDTIARAPAALARRLTGKAAGNVETFWALKDLDFEVQQGQVLGVLGRNGAGKSTLLKLLSRVTDPSAGRATIRGRVASLLEVGTGFHPELTGRENIFLNGAILGMKREETKRRFDEIVAFAEVERFLDTPVKRYSSGMYVRLAFSVAAHLEPEILIVDEVLAVGDRDFQKKCIGRMSDVAGEGRTVIFVSHNIHVLRDLCTHGLVLQNGRNAFSGTIAGAIEHYTNASAQAGEKLYPNGKLVKRVAVRQEGGNIVLECDYDDADKQLDIPSFGYIIHDADGRPILGHNPVIEGSYAGLEFPRTGTVRATISQPRLLDGSYLVSIFLGDAYTTYFSEDHCVTLAIEGMVSAVQLPAARVGPVYPQVDYEFIGEGLHTRLTAARGEG